MMMRPATKSLSEYKDTSPSRNIKAMMVIAIPIESAKRPNVYGKWMREAIETPIKNENVAI
jgi:hypothetical protein